MARKHQAEALLRAGSWPGQIAVHMGISVSSVIQYLRVRVGEGSLRLSDLLFSYPEDLRVVMKQLCQKKRTSMEQLSKHGLTREDFELYKSIQNTRTLNGDMYDNIARLECALHAVIRIVLARGENSGGDIWWRRGVPTGIRVACAQRRELDDEPLSEIFAYTTFIELFEIIEKNWKMFSVLLPPRYQAQRKSLERDFSRLNRIRNAVMHPVKEREWDEEDFVFTRTISHWAEQELVPAALEYDHRSGVE
jgi:hypothetical protein